MSGPSQSDEDHQLIDWLRDRWSRASVTERRLTYLLAIWVGLALGAWLVASLVWREDLSRSTITTTALVLMAIAALLLFGATGSKTLVAVLTAGVTIGAIGGGALNSGDLLPDGPAPRGAVIDCLDLASDYEDEGIVAETELGYTHLRAEPSLHSEIKLRLATGCKLGFSGYCLGEPKADWRFGTPDPVWFELADEEGYIASADLRTGPPGAEVSRGECPNGEPDPQLPEITAPLRRRLSGPVEITVAAPDSVIVGFAAHYSDAPFAPAGRWHQIGLDTSTGDGISIAWDTRSVPGQSGKAAAAVTLAAVSCHGLEFPDDYAAFRAYAVANVEPSAARKLSLEYVSPEGAQQVACANPDR